MIKDKFNRSGKEQYRQLDTPKTEEKTTTVNTEGNKSEAPKKKKNIIRVFHAQNASDGGKGRRKPAAGERKGFSLLFFALGHDRSGHKRRRKGYCKGEQK